MRIEERKPRETRFEADNAEARLSRLKEQAPTLGNNRRMRMYAIFGSALVFLTVLGFYYAIQIYKAATEDRLDQALIEVDSAPELRESETEKALARIEEEEIAAEATYQEQLEELKTVDLLSVEEAPAKAKELPGG